jgi:uncharacterized protein
VGESEGRSPSGKSMLRSAILLLALLTAAPLAAGERLIDAVRAGDAAAVRALLDSAAVDVTAAEPDGTTALHVAVQQGNLELAKGLIARGASVAVETRYGITPLYLAAERGDARIVEALIEAGADVNAATPQGVTPLMMAARTGRPDAVDVLLARGARAAINLQESWRGQSALMWAAGEGHVPVVRQLAAAGADLRSRSKSGFSPLLFAVRNGHMPAIETLLTLGADPNDRVERPQAPARAGGEGGTTRPRPSEDTPEPTTSALGMAVINAYYDVAALLLDRGADPNIADPRGSMLHALSFMRRAGSGNPPRSSGQLDSLDLVHKLLEKGANPNTRIAWKEVIFDRDNAVTRLPPNIPVGRNFLSFIGATPLYVAAKHGDVEMMRLLLKYGADPTINTVQAVTPLMAAAGLGFWDGESPGPLTGVPESEHVEAVGLLLDLGLDINARTKFGGPEMEGDGYTLLRRHPLNLEKYDGPHDAPLDVVPPELSLGDLRWDGSTALHGAAMRGANLIVELLVSRGAKLDARNTVGWTPLMCAEGLFVANTEKDWPDTVSLLRRLMTEHGLDPAQADQSSLGGSRAGQP